MKFFSQYHRDLLSELTKKEIKVRYKNSYLGYLWSIANPLMLSLVFYFVFKVVTKVQMENYALFLISGLFVWQWILNSIMMGSMLYISNASLIKKVNFPRYFLVIALVLSEGFNFVISIAVIVIFLLYYGMTPSFNWILGIPLLFFITGVFVFSLSLLIASVNLFFRDMERLIGILMTFIFYMTPILYPTKMVPDGYEWSYLLNPFASYIISWRELFLHGDLMWNQIVIAIAYALFSLIAALFVYNKLKYKFAELV